LEQLLRVWEDNIVDTDPVSVEQRHLTPGPSPTSWRGELAAKNTVSSDSRHYKMIIPVTKA
jgi:hypothetical protein